MTFMGPSVGVGRLGRGECQKHASGTTPTRPDGRDARVDGAAPGRHNPPRPRGARRASARAPHVPFRGPPMGRIFETRKATMFARWDKMSKAFARIGKEVTMAVKAAGPNPDSNP